MACWMWSLFSKDLRKTLSQIVQELKWTWPMCSSISSCVVKFLAQTWHMMWFCLCISSSVSLPGTSADAPTVSNISPSHWNPTIVRFYILHFHFYHFLVLENLLSSRNKRHSHLYGIVFHFVAFFVIVHMDKFILYSGTLYYFFFYSARPMRYLSN